MLNPADANIAMAGSAAELHDEEEKGALPANEKGDNDGHDAQGHWWTPDQPEHEPKPTLTTTNVQRHDEKDAVALAAERAPPADAKFGMQRTETVGRKRKGGGKGEGKDTPPKKKEREGKGNGIWRTEAETKKVHCSHGHPNEDRHEKRD